MRRFIFFVLILALFTTGCLSRTQGPVIDSQHGLVTVALSDADPIPWSPYNPPILDAAVQPANPLIAYEACQELLDQPFQRVCAADWVRSVITPEELESISVTIMTGSEPTRFRVVFVGHRPGSLPDGFAISREYIAPPYWNGKLEFEVPVYPPFTRVFHLQIQWRSEDGWSGSDQDVIFAPCPLDLPWPDGDKEYCDSVAR